MALTQNLLQEKRLQIWQGLQIVLRWCFQWTSPMPASADAPLAQKEAIRRGQLTSIVLLILIGCMLAYVPTMLSLHMPLITLLYISLFAFMGLAAFMNRVGRSNTAGFIVMMSVESISVALIFFFPSGFDLRTLPMYDFLIIPTLLAVSLLPPWSVFPVALSNIAVIVLTTLFLPKGPELQALVSAQPQAVLGVPIIIQSICSAISFLWVQGSLQALKEANRADNLDRLYHEQAHVAETDAITGLPNHRALMNYLREAIDLCEEKQEKFTLMFVDLDHFKQINDTWGHLAGDAVLRQAGRSLQTTLSAYGTVARYGGEEFAVVLKEGDLQRAYELAEQARNAIASSPCLWEVGDKAEKIEIGVTGSIGLALYGLHGLTTTSLLEQADHAMYQAKLQGRNRVVSSPVRSEVDTLQISQKK